MKSCPSLVADDCLALRVPVALVPRVDAALRREGLDVSNVADPSLACLGVYKVINLVVESAPPDDVPRTISWDGPKILPWR